MFAEVQVLTSRLLEQLREGLREAVAGVVVQEWSAFGQTLMFDHVDVRDTTTLDQPERPNLTPKKYDDWPYHVAGSDPLSAFPEVRVDAKPIILRQTLDVFPVLLLAGGTSNPQLVELPSFSFSFSLEIEAVVVEEPIDPKRPRIVPRTKPALVVTPFLFEFQPIPRVADALARRAEDALATAIGSKTLDIPLAGPMTDLNYVNAGITALGGGTRVALRFQAGFLPKNVTEAKWQEFHDGRSIDLTDPGLNGHEGPPWDWAVQIDLAFLQTMIASEATRRLAHPSSQIWLSNRGVQVDVLPAGDHLQVRLEAPLDIATGVLGISVTVDAGVSMDMHLDAAGQLVAVIDGRVSVEVPLDQALLLIAAGAALATAIAVIASVPMWLFFLIQAIISAIDLLGELAAAPVLPTDDSLPCSEEPFQIDPTSLSVSKRIVCRLPASQKIPLTRRDQAQLKQLFVLGDQVIAAGTLTPLPRLPRPTWSLDVGDGLWRGPHISCADAGDAQKIIDAFRADPRSAVCVSDIVLDVTPSPAPTTDVAIVNAWIASDDYDIATAKVVDRGVVEIQVHYDAGFMADPKPLYVLVHTSDGPRLVQLPPLPAVDIKALSLSILGDVSRCREKVDEFYRRFGRYNVKWGSDPAIRATAQHELWAVRVTGVDAGESIDVFDASGEMIGTAVAGPDGSAVLVHLADTALPGSGALELGRSSNSERATGRGTGAVRVLQTSLLRQGHVDVGEGVRGFAVGRVGARDVLVLTRQATVDIYNLSQPHKPAFIGSLRDRGYRATRFDGGSILAWGDEGLDRIVASDDLSKLTPTHLLTGCVTAAVPLRDRYVALTPAGLVTIDRETGHAEATIPARGSSLVATADAVVVAGLEGVDVFDAGANTTPVAHLDVEARRLHAAGLSFPGTLVAETPDGAVGIDVSVPRAAEIRHAWPSTPAHAYAATSGGIVAMRATDGTIAILRRGARRQV